MNGFEVTTQDVGTDDVEIDFGRGDEPRASAEFEAEVEDSGVELEIDQKLTGPIPGAYPWGVRGWAVCTHLLQVPQASGLASTRPRPSAQEEPRWISTTDVPRSSTSAAATTGTARPRTCTTST